MRYEILENSIVVNTIIADEQFMLEHYPEGNYLLVPELMQESSVE